MVVQGIAPLRAADEGLNHQIVNTFGAVGEADFSWTEKIWASLAKMDGSLQVDFGLGRYHNRDVMDGFGGVSRGREQWTVRASRELSPAPEATSVGPVVYEVVDPLKAVRFKLEPNDVLDFSFDLLLEGVLPPFFEVRNAFLDQATGRSGTDLVRYHQGGRITGTLVLQGATHQVNPDEWFGFRDHSWGVRGQVGMPPPDLKPRPEFAVGGVDSVMHWTPWWLQRPNGSYYGVGILKVSASTGTGGVSYGSYFLNHPDGRQEPVRVEPHLSYDKKTRFMEGGEIHLETESGQKRVFEIEALGGSGFHLAAGGYGRTHGKWMGARHVEGEYIADCWDNEHLPRLGQFRDKPVRVREGDAVGYGIFESVIMGSWPDLGLDENNEVPSGL